MEDRAAQQQGGAGVHHHQQHSPRGDEPQRRGQPRQVGCLCEGLAWLGSRHLMAPGVCMTSHPPLAPLLLRYVVQEIIKEMAKSRPIGADGQRGFKAGGKARAGRQARRGPPPSHRRASCPPPPCLGRRCWSSTKSTGCPRRRSTRCAARWRSTAPRVASSSAATTCPRWVGPGGGCVGCAPGGATDPAAAVGQCCACELCPLRQAGAWRALSTRAGHRARAQPLPVYTRGGAVPGAGGAAAAGGGGAGGAGAA